MDSYFNRIGGGLDCLCRPGCMSGGWGETDLDLDAPTGHRTNFLLSGESDNASTDRLDSTFALELLG
jgi:hypothetical protein